MAPITRLSLKRENNNISNSTDEIEGNNDKKLLEIKKQKTITTKKSKSPSLRIQLSAMTIPVLKNILRFNHQNPFGNKSDLLSRIIYMVGHGIYPRCPKCTRGRLKPRLHRRKNQSKYYCPGFPNSFRAPASYHQCDHVIDECKKEKFRFPSNLNLKINNLISVMNLLRLCHRIINPTRFSLNRQLQKLSIAPKTPLTSLSVGQELNGYIVKEITPIPEFRLTAIKLQHKLTGCQHLHIDREHKNNVWSVAFQTTPKDDTGVAHILEHTALCGSEKFPCRDPFFKMTNRSMATFMNAFTASDWTMYAFSTQNQKDYFNLMSIYLDAVLHPKLDEYDFMQEGWRLEHEKIDDPTSPIVIKGVVFNEMKGVFSNSHQVYARQVQNNLMPTSTYQYESGGDPEKIPILTWNALREFHTTHYHPSNGRFFTYGSFPLSDTLAFLNDYLHHYEQQKAEAISSKLIEESHWNKSRSVNITCSPQSFVVDPNKTTTVSVSYLLGSIRNTWETFLLNIVCSLLVESENSPFYKKLIIPNIGNSYSPDTGFGRHTLNTTFHVGLQDISKNDVDRVVKIIDETFQEVARKGFEQSQIDALLHQFELGIKHQDENFGLKIILGLIYSWIHDTDPIDSLQITKYLEKFNDEMTKNPRLLQDIVEKYFLKNNHKLIATMNIDEEYSEKKKQKESQLCQQLISQCKDKQLIYEKGLELQKRQSAPQNVDVLPTLSITDIDKKAIRVPIIQGQIGNTYVQLCEQPTNGIIYFRCLLNTFELPNELKSYLPLFINILTK
ncbi:unnamed protein product [Rotaria sordida]|uniref:Presequence protease, mitochondrial n=1 Tax=Rotaria sordida TaxID=392033 RepID=A0A814JZ42_9BILA|nr:unnamed protein product [Rotaria sordida]CAF1044496.1 unnamed protein product [Rotaria sordida]